MACPANASLPGSSLLTIPSTLGPYHKPVLHGMETEVSYCKALRFFRSEVGWKIPYTDHVGP
ncbi:hypothetical protein B1J92_L04836g [Nakaseomyces glabratus]|nr:hypothetical protein B1J91_L04836g [Nakaseomyces glabratus]OXB46295.1 hypothetical protein B1J92_L04836g [Nakaseomyces glabratus]